jgi:hypothetical protein
MSVTISFKVPAICLQWFLAQFLAACVPWFPQRRLRMFLPAAAAAAAAAAKAATTAAAAAAAAAKPAAGPRALASGSFSACGGCERRRPPLGCGVGGGRAGGGLADEE